MPAERPDPHEYFMGIAMAVRRRADCIGNRVGSVIVLNRRIISTGYNGTPENMDNCSDGGCHRCANRDKYPPEPATICVSAFTRSRMRSSLPRASASRSMVQASTPRCDPASDAPRRCSRQGFSRCTSFRLGASRPREADAIRAYPSALLRWHSPFGGS